MSSSRPFVIEHIVPRAENYLRRLPRPKQKVVARAFDHLCNVSPFSHPNPTTIRPLKGTRKGQWRFRAGGIRIIYTVNTNAHTIHILAIDTRGSVY